MTSLDQAVCHDDQVDKPDPDPGQVQEGLFRSLDAQPLAKGDLCRVIAVMRANSLAHEAPTC